MALYFEDFAVGQSDAYGACLVTRDEVIAFATRYDPQPFHLDDEAAARHAMFGRISASGWHTAAMAMRLTVDHWRSLNVRALGSPGLDELAWLHPVYPGDTLRLEGEVVAARVSASRPEVGLIKVRSIVYNQHDVAVMRQVANVMIARRPAAS